MPFGKYFLEGMNKGIKSGADAYGRERDAQLKELLLGKQQELSDQSAIAKEQRNKDALAEFLKANPGRSVSAGGFSVGAPQAPGSHLTPAQMSAEREAGKTIQDYQTAGGSAGFDKKIGNMESVAKELETADRGFFTKAAGILPDAARDFLTPEERSREDRIKTAVQESLKQVLGGQFTQEEAKQLMDRAYNPRLSNEENIRRIQTAVEELRQKKAAIESGIDRYNRTGYATMGGPTPGARGASPSLPGSSGLSADEMAELEQLRKELGQ